MGWATSSFNISYSPPPYIITVAIVLVDTCRACICKCGRWFKNKFWMNSLIKQQLNTYGAD